MATRQALTKVFTQATIRALALRRGLLTLIWAGTLAVIPTVRQEAEIIPDLRHTQGELERAFQRPPLTAICLAVMRLLIERKRTAIMIPVLELQIPRIGGAILERRQAFVWVRIAIRRRPGLTINRVKPPLLNSYLR